MEGALARGAGMTCIALVASSCSTESVALKAFAKSVSCPPDRIEVRKRPDVAPHTIAEQSGVLASPSPDVAADPVRLRYWKQQRADLDRRLDDFFTVYEARGCGVQQLLCCTFLPAEGDAYCDKDCANVMAPGSP
jgi:hypothetical protein